MSTFVAVLLILAMLSTLGILVAGVLSMARGGDFNKRNANKLMRARVLAQFVALIFFVILMLILGKG